MSTLGQIISDTLPRLRAEAESMMVDTVLIERATGSVTTDPVTLEDTPEWETVHEGPARAQRPDLQPADQVVGEIEYGLLGLLIQLPLSAVGIERNDRVTVTAVGPLTDADLLGVVGTVRGNLTKTHPTKRTLVCQEVT